MCETNTRIFISYSWSNTERVIELAQRLTDHGINVIIDRWELKEGQDKYAFMEQSVTDNTISKVLIICDKDYAEKANNRKGGVGDETMIISAEVYGKVSQEKFIPVIFERDEDGNEYVPAYLKSRIYIDLSDADQYESNYDRLLKNLYNKPEYSKPPLGKMPEWLNGEIVSFTPIRTLIKQLQTLDGKNQSKQRYLIKKFNDEFIKTLNELALSNDANLDDVLLKQIDIAKPIRDLFLDYVETLVINDYNVGDSLGDFFEQIYNCIYHIDGNRYSCVDSECEFGFFMIWEMFICTIAVLLHHENYKDIFNILNRTYFLHEDHIDQDPKPNSFIQFWSSNHYIENSIKPKGGNPNIHTLAGDILVKREKQQIITKYTMANADVILYQLSRVYNNGHDYCEWFPILYPYLGSQYRRQQIWSKMISRRHCEKLFPLFGVTQLSQLVEQIKKKKPDKVVRYPRASYIAPFILQSIELEKIGTMP